MMMLEPGERRSTVETVQAHLRDSLTSANSTTIVAQSERGLVGYVEAEDGTYRRTRHSAYVVIGVLRSHRGQGIGRAMLSALRS